VSPGARDFKAITPAWLTSMFRESGVLSAAAVRSISAEPIGIGVGFLGQLARLRLAYDRQEEGAPATIIAKLPTLDPGGRRICQLFRFYEREIRFYRDLAREVPVRVPRCYASVMDVAADDYIALLEDLGGLPMGSDATGCTAAEAETAIRTVARLHARWWESPALERLDWIPMVNDPIHHFAQGAYQQALVPFLQTFGDHLSPKMRVITENLGPRIVELQNIGSQFPRTVLHGDYRLDNLFFDGASVAVIDWQIACRGQGVFDVAYFLSGCLEPAVRRAEEMRLLRLWYDLATDGHAGRFSFDDALVDYRRSVLFCHLYSVIATGSLDAASERGMQVFTGGLRRRGAAIEELEAGELMPR
jgi:hypothetical protein